MFPDFGIRSIVFLTSSTHLTKLSGLPQNLQAAPEFELKFELKCQTNTVSEEEEEVMKKEDGRGRGGGRKKNIKLDKADQTKS